ncbi:hypothetical protein FKM82_006986 [Ascaphus truei]
MLGSRMKKWNLLPMFTPGRMGENTITYLPKRNKPWKLLWLRYSWKQRIVEGINSLNGLTGSLWYCSSLTSDVTIFIYGLTTLLLSAGAGFGSIVRTSTPPFESV